MRGGTGFDNTGIVSTDDLIVSLRRDPTPEEHAIAEGVGLHDGAHVPFHMFVKAAMQSERNREWIGGVDDLMKKARHRALAALGALVLNLGAFGGFLLHRAAEDGAASERVVQFEQRAVERRDALEREIQDLRIDVRELRAAMRRMSGADALGPESSEAPMDPDRLSVLGGALEIFASGVPKPLPHPRLCGQTCNSSIECSGGVTRSCPFCNFGTCRSTRPEQPIPVDAGVDAPSGTQP